MPSSGGRCQPIIVLSSLTWGSPHPRGRLFKVGQGLWVLPECCCGCALVDLGAVSSSCRGDRQKKATGGLLLGHRSFSLGVLGAYMCDEWGGLSPNPLGQRGPAAAGTGTIGLSCAHQPLLSPSLTNSFPIFTARGRVRPSCQAEEKPAAWPDLHGLPRAPAHPTGSTACASPPALCLRQEASQASALL